MEENTGTIDKTVLVDKTVLMGFFGWNSFLTNIFSFTFEVSTYRLSSVALLVDTSGRYADNKARKYSECKEGDSKRPSAVCQK